MSNQKVAAAIAFVLTGSAAGMYGTHAHAQAAPVVVGAGEPAGRTLPALREKYGIKLVAVGPIDRVTGPTTAEVLGNLVAGAPVGDLRVGDLVAVIGSAANDGRITAEHLIPLGIPYVPGSTRVSLAAVANEISYSTARMRVGSVYVDFSATLSRVGAASPQLGQLIYFEGIQPVSGGVFLADQAIDSDLLHGLDGSLGTGRSTDGSLGTGRSTDGSLGTGRSTDGSLGTGRSTDGSLGTGRSTDGSLGTGRSTDGSLGTGRSTDGSLGTG